MPLQKLQFRPGVNREGTTLANEGGWFECDKVRFRSGYPEKIGGWSALSTNTFLGLCRSLWNWVTLKNFNLLGVGTNLKFYVESGGEYSDITPIRLTTNNTTTFSSTSGSKVITVTDTSVSGLQAGDFVTFSNSTNVGGLDLNNEYQIQSVISAIVYTIQASTNANGSGGNGGGAVDAAYQLNTGSATYAYSNGWGIGPWPQYNTTTLSNPFATTNGSTTVTVTQTAHGLTTGDYVYFTGTEVTIATGATTTVTIATNGFTAGQAVRFNVTTSGELLPTGMTIGTIYYAGVITATTFVLYNTQANAISGGATGKIVTSGAALGTVICENAAAVNGIPADVLYKAFQVTVVNANSYTISTVIGAAPGPVLSYPATSTGSSKGGTVTVDTPTGTVRGWGSAFNGGTFGVQLRLWSQSNFGEDLLFSPRGGGLYLWQPGAGSTPAFSTRGTLVSGTDVPAYINQIMVSDSSRIVIAFGCNDYGAYGTTGLEPMLIRWTAQESYTDWTISTTNQAGSYRLSHGSQIVGALQTRQEIVVWTDAAIYAMQYLGPPYVWGFTLLADNISIISPNATATASGVTYWMGADKFYVYSGRVETLPCSLRSFVFNDINRDQAFQVYAGSNEAYSEIWWFYCSRNSTVIDRYVIFNYLDRVWYYGTMGRTAWLDSPLRQSPMATTYNNITVFHESGVDDGDVVGGATSKPIYSYIQSSDFDIGDGHNYGFVWRMLPDITFDGSNAGYPKATFTMRPRQNPGAPYNGAPSPTVSAAVRPNQPPTYGAYSNTVQTYNVQEFTEIIYTRVRGRQMAFKIESNTLGTQWQLGVPRLDVRPDGRRA